MKSTFLIVFLVLILNAGAQAPRQFSYQCVIRNSSNAIVENKTVKMRISILKNSINNNSLYTEEHSVSTNKNGLATLQIGNGTVVSGNFSNIEWGNGIYFLKSETDINNGTNFTIVGTTQLLSVPYSLQSGNGFSAVSPRGDTLFLDNGKFLIIPGISVANPSSSRFNQKLSYDNLIDIDGNNYKTIAIGNQIWMAENLKVTRYRNGNPISLVSNNLQWQNTTTGAWSYYNNDSVNNNLYGKLYNWFAVNNEICPSGWHVPSDAEWSVLENVLEGSTIAGGKMKSITSNYWKDPNTGATNASGYSALPGGFRNNSGQFSAISNYGAWWTSTANGTNQAWERDISFNAGSLYRSSYSQNYGFAVRCLKD